MNILLASSEVAPFAKSGGLADVCSALPGQLVRMGHHVDVFLPAYRRVHDARIPVSRTGIGLQIQVGQRSYEGELLRTTSPGGVDVWLVHQPELFDRPGLYGENGQDYGDNCARFSFFSRAVLEAIRVAGLGTEVIHCNDWQTGLIPAILATQYRQHDRYRRVASLLTIHNLAYQGLFTSWDMQQTGLDWSLFNWRQMEFFGQLNLLKTGIVFADALSTVSPTYAREIQGEEQGYGLDGVLRERADSLSGILNGIDNEVWNPAVDGHLVRTYGPADWQEGKAVNKAALQREFGLAVDGRAPLIGLVGRLASQKGWSLILPVMQQWLGSVPAQWAVLGSGEKAIEDQLLELERRFPGRIAVRIGFSEPLAHRIEAGADLFAMPSRYEPCGLNQMYSMAYGTVPVARQTGGLADTVLDPAQHGMAAATGFVFVAPRPEQFEQALSRAVMTWSSQPDAWSRLVSNGMQRDWSWQTSAGKYCQLYRALIDSRS